MKCNKCWVKINPDEEIRAEEQYYCETCYKSDSWKRTLTSVSINVFAGSVMLLLFFIAYWCWRETKTRDCQKKPAKD